MAFIPRRKELKIANSVLDRHERLKFILVLSMSNIGPLEISGYFIRPKRYQDESPPSLRNTEARCVDDWEFVRQRVVVLVKPGDAVSQFPKPLQYRSDSLALCIVSEG